MLNVHELNAQDLQRLGPGALADVAATLTVKEWIGGSFDPAAFDVAEVNRTLNPTEP